METYKKLVPQLEDDLEKFDVSTNLVKFPESKSVNIKHVIYRSITLFVSALGRSYGVRKHCSFEIINELKRRNELSNRAAHILSMAVAVACHIRLVHYSSKNRQDDVIYKEQEQWGREKLGELTKIVCKRWLLRSLVTTRCLQSLLRLGKPIRNFDAMSASQQISEFVGTMVGLGMDKDNIAYTEQLLKKLPTLRPLDCYGLVIASISYQKLGLNDKAIELFSILRRKLEKPLQAIDESPNELEKVANSEKLYIRTRSRIDLFEARALLLAGEYLRANEMMEKVLKSNVTLPPDGQVVVLIYNIKCKVSLWKCREALSSIRDLLRAHGFEKLKHWFNCALVVTIFRNITYSLIRVGKKEQGLHWAKQGLYFAEENDLTSNHIQNFIVLIKQIAERDASDLADKNFPYRQKWS